MSKSNGGRSNGSSGAGSSGPRTPAGKRRSAQNASKHKIFAGRILPGEQKEALKLFAQFQEELRPECSLESEIISDLVQNRMQARRIDKHYIYEVGKAGAPYVLMTSDSSMRATGHRIGVAVTTGLVMILAAFVVMQGAQLRRTTRERDRANRERDRATRITDFMTGMFKVSDPSEARGDSITAREILDKASKDADTGLAKDPETQAQMMQVMGDVYDGLGLYARAEPLLRQSMEIRKRVLGPEHPETLKSMHSVANAMWYEGRHAEAEKLDRETLEIERRVLGPEHPETLTVMMNLAGVLAEEGHYAEAEKWFRETIDIQHRVLGPEQAGSIGESRRNGALRQSLVPSHALIFGTWTPPTYPMVMGSSGVRSMRCGLGFCGFFSALAFSSVAINCFTLSGCK